MSVAAPSAALQESERLVDHRERLLAGGRGVAVRDPWPVERAEGGDGSRGDHRWAQVARLIAEVSCHGLGEDVLHSSHESPTVSVEGLRLLHHPLAAELPLVGEV